jgi:hypothetical protein
MVRKESADKVLLTVAQPDLALYRGPSDEAFDKDGKRMERSIYSRPWIDNESGEIPVTVTLKGRRLLSAKWYPRIKNKRYSASSVRMEPAMR